MKTTVSKPIARVVVVAFLGVSALFSNATYAECKYTNGNPVTGPIIKGQHCSRGYLVPDGQDFCKKDTLSEYQGPDRAGYPSWNLSNDKFGKVYAVQDLKCIPGGLVIKRNWNWCELDQKTKMGMVIKEGQPCRGTIIQPLPPSN